ncbi:MAG TPA: alpha/beta fold hydrolase [Pirellulales bacterium]|jgi:haloalkane dehalogenase|nr:alpha/beta fold hydrolase [Pirellulales bacterium]
MTGADRERLPEADWRALYPFGSRFLRVAAGQYHYLDEGAGKPLLLVHGNPTWSFHWRNLIAAWRGRHRIVAPDHLGCGLSDKPATFDYRLSSHIANLSRLVDELDLRDATLVAQDWGGAIGLGAVLRSPERFSRLVLFNTGAFRAPRMPWRIRICRTPGVGPVLVRGLNGFSRAALRMAVAHPERLTPAVRAGYLFPYDSWRNRIAIDRFVHDIPMRPSHPSYGQLVEIERGLPLLADRPTQLIWGMRDWCFTPWFLERFIEIFPAAEVHRVPDAGHWVVEDACEQIVPLVERFLQT